MAAFAVCLFLFSLCVQVPCSSSSSHGIHPLDEKYYHGDFIRCKDGSKSFSRDRLNDNFCDCLDGTDEPGTSACPAGKFYCRNAGSTPRFLFSSRVNDDICDCCDGSDEYDGTVICPNTCVMGGDIVYQTRYYDSFGNSRKSKPGINTEESTHKLIGLKALVWLQLGFVVFFVTFRLFCKRRARRRTRLMGSPLESFSKLGYVEPK